MVSGDKPAEGKPAGDKPAEGKPDDQSWRTALGTLAAILGLLGFLGIANFDDLRHRLFPPPPRPVVASPTPRATPNPETIRWTYIRRADTACAKAVGTAGTLPTVNQVTYDWMNNWLVLRREMLADWQAVKWPLPSVDAVNSGRLGKLWADFDSVIASWTAMMADLRAKNYGAFNRDLGFHDSANKSFVDGANTYGFSVCNYSFASVSPFT
jgi:hypothetical protein